MRLWAAAMLGFLECARLTWATCKGWWALAFRLAVSGEDGAPLEVATAGQILSSGSQYMAHIHMHWYLFSKYYKEAQCPILGIQVCYIFSLTILVSIALPGDPGNL